LFLPPARAQASNIFSGGFFHRDTRRPDALLRRHSTGPGVDGARDLADYIDMSLTEAMDEGD
jgi:hypothetical protein